MTVSDIIEKFLLDTLGDETAININRNELATFFSVAPSQINYVLATRFTPERGYIIESRRGGGGSIKIIRVEMPVDDIMNECIGEMLDNGIEYGKACQILERLTQSGVYTESEAGLIRAAISDKALLAPTVSKARLRGSIFKSILIETLKRNFRQNNG